MYESETDSQTKIRLVVAMEEEGLEMERLGIWGQQMQTIIYRKDKKQRYSIWNYNIIQYPVINHNGKEYEKECM